MTSLRNQALHGFFWSFTERFGLQGVQFGITVVLARLLEPSDFGLIAMLMVFMALSQTIVDSGFGSALIQKKDVSPDDKSTVFWVNLLLGLLMTGALYGVAPWVARFYEMPLLVPILRVKCLGVVLSSLCAVHSVLLVRELAFKRRMRADMIALCVSGAVGITMAVNGYGVWSLVVQGLVMSGVRMVGLWWLLQWRPAFVFNPESFRSLWRFGSNMLFSGLLNTLFQNIYYVVIGKLFAAADLGFYQRGGRLVKMSSHSVSQVISQVNFPLLSRMQNDPELIKNTFQQVLQAALFVITPGMVALSVMAPDIILIVFGEKWLPSAPYLRIMSLTAILFPLHLLNLNILMAMGRSDLFFRLEMIKKLLIIGNIAINWRFGIMALIWGQMVCSVIAVVINSYYSRRFINYGLVQQLFATRGVVLSSIVLAVVLGGVAAWSPALPIVRALLQLAIGGAVYLGVAWLIREPSLLAAVDLLKSRGV